MAPRKGPVAHRDDRPCLVGVEQLNGGQTGLMGLVDQPLQDRQLVFRGADRGCRRRPIRNRLLRRPRSTTRELPGRAETRRSAGRVPATSPAPRPEPSRAGPSSFSSSTTDAPRAPSAAALAAPTMPLPTTTTSALRGSVVAGLPDRGVIVGRSNGTVLAVAQGVIGRRIGDHNRTRHVVEFLADRSTA